MNSKNQALQQISVIPKTGLEMSQRDNMMYGDTYSFYVLPLTPLSLFRGYRDLFLLIPAVVPQNLRRAATLLHFNFFSSLFPFPSSTTEFAMCITHQEKKTISKRLLHNSQWLSSPLLRGYLESDGKKKSHFSMVWYICLEQGVRIQCSTVHLSGAI